MRMWMIDPALLCSRHLSGEHGEIHKHLPSFRRGHSVSGRFAPVVQIQLNAILARHDELAAEIDRRAQQSGRGGHHSPLTDLPDLQAIYPDHYSLCVDIAESVRDLCERCPECRDRILSIDKLYNMR